jgi:hypothetical protein
MGGGTDESEKSEHISSSCSGESGAEHDVVDDDDSEKKSDDGDVVSVSPRVKESSNGSNK